MQVILGLMALAAWGVAGVAIYYGRSDIQLGIAVTGFFAGVTFIALILILSHLQQIERGMNALSSQQQKRRD